MPATHAPIQPAHVALAVKILEARKQKATDPVRFARDRLGHNLWPASEAILAALTKPRARVAVKGCHASSKTFTAAEAVLWVPHAGGIAITTAPTARQVSRMVWAEIHSMYPRARQRLDGQLLLTPEFRISPDEYSLGVSTDKGVNFQGFHARDGGFMLIVLDEAPGVQPSVYDAIEGVRAGGDVRVLALGNPDVPSGPFYDAFTKDRSGWETFTIDAFTSPNFEDEENPGTYLTLDQLLTLPEHRIDYAPRPYLITRRFVREKYDEWGLASPLWASKVRGGFPDQGEDSLISLAWIESAKNREPDAKPDDMLTAGIDVAGPGEAETVLIVRRGAALEGMWAWAEPDPRGKVLEALEPYRSNMQAVNVDSVGIGYYFGRHLEDNGWHGRIHMVNVGVPASNTERYANLKAELYWSLRMRFQSGDMSYINDNKLISQLSSIKYKPNPRGQITIERKDEALKRGVASPDRAEALMLAYMPTGGGTAEVPAHVSRWTGGRHPESEEASLARDQSRAQGRTTSRWRR